MAHEKVTTLWHTKRREQNLDQRYEVTLEFKETIAAHEEGIRLQHTKRREQDLDQI